MLITSSGDPPNFNMLDILSKLFLAGQITHVADFVLKVLNIGDDNSDKIELAFSGPKLVKKMVEQHRFDHAVTYLDKFQLQDDTELKNYIFQRMICEGQYDRCISDAEALKLPEETLPPEEKEKQLKYLYKSIVTYMLKRGRIEFALKHIDKLNLTDQFDVEDLFQKLSAKNDFPPILRFAGRYNLIGKFPVKLLVQKMLDNAQWKEAWKTVQMKGLTKIFPLHTIVEKAANAGNFSIVAQFIEDHSLAPRMSKTLDEFENKLMNQIVQFEKIEEEKEKNKIPSSPRRPSMEGLQDTDDNKNDNSGDKKNQESAETNNGKINQNQPSSPKTGKPSIKPIMTIEYK